MSKCAKPRRLATRLLGAAMALSSVILLSNTALAQQESPYLYGIHDIDPNPQGYMDHISGQGATGWITATYAIGANPSDNSGTNASGLANQGHSIIGRLNYGYCPDGSIPPSNLYANFAQRCANFVANSSGINIWVIGNETNLASEWPVVNGYASYVSPQSYATCFRQVYNAIKAVRPNAKVVPQALAPWAGPYNAGPTNACGSPGDGNPLNWVTYLNQMLTAIKNSGGIDGIALHINSRGYAYGDIHSTAKVNAGGQNLYWSFYVYKDWINLGIPSSLYNLPLYATECNGTYYWSGGHPENPNAHYLAGWMQEIYAEINNWNQTAIATGKPVFHCVNMYRWCNWCDPWNIDGSPYKGQILSDLDQAASMHYTWPTSGGGGGGTMNSNTPTGVNLAPASTVTTDTYYNGDNTGAKAIDTVVSASSKWTSTAASSTHWLVLDLGSNKVVNGYIVRHASAGGEPTYYNTQTFQLQVGTSSSGPWTTDSTVDNSAQAGVTTRSYTTPKTVRYVRLYITDAGTDNYARIPEFEVYGPVDTGMNNNTPTGTNLALSATQYSSDTAYDAGTTAIKARDGIVSSGSKWTSTGASSTHWLKYDLGASKTVNGFIVRHASAGGEPTYLNTQQFKIQSSTSYNGTYTDEVSVDNNAQAGVTTKSYNTPKTLRYVRLYITDAGIDNYARIPEFEVWGVGGGGGGTTTVSEDFNSVPSWASSFDAAWGGAATWSAVSGGQSGNALQATRGNMGSSAKVQVYSISANTNYTISVYMKCPSSSSDYWAECQYKLGNYSAQDFDGNAATWTPVKKFSNTGTNGNGNVWTQYSATFNSGANTQISVGFKTGNSSGSAPTVQWDTLRVQ